MRRIASTARGTLRPRGVAGQQVLDLHQQLARLIETRTDDRSAFHFLAEPMVNRARDQIDWYSRADGPVRAATELSAAERNAALAAANGRVARIRALADELRATGNAQRIADADLLAAAVVDPRPEDLVMVGDQPVLINWGADLAGATRPVVEAAQPRRAAPAPVGPASAGEAVGVTREIETPPPPVRPKPRWKPLIAWSAGTVAALVAVPFVLVALFPPGRQAVEAAVARKGELQVAIATRKAEIDVKRWQCADDRDQTAVGLGSQEIVARMKAANAKFEGLSVFMAWNGKDDLDLELKLPSGVTISRESPTSGDGGRRLAAANDDETKTDRPIEVICFADARGLRGKFQPVARLRRYHPELGPPRPITVILGVTLDGKAVDYTTFVFGAVGDGQTYVSQRADGLSFTLPPPATPPAPRR